MSPALFLALGCSFGSFLAFAVNLPWYRKPKPGMPGCRISVLIPARNEENGITAAVESVLASTGVELELLVLDDSSADRTAPLVAELARKDGRVRLLSGGVLPGGWNGKQHACAVLGREARYELLCFLDADVRLAPEALQLLAGQLGHSRVDLLSGFPREEAETWLEKLLLPLIHFVLLCFLPLPVARAQPRRPSLSAGCGQLMLLRGDAYRSSGGHEAIRETMHDGLLLPRLLREHGFATDICDLTALAHCRMYRNAGEVWRGLGKNATEGMAAPARIVPFSLMLFFGQVLPVVLLARAVWAHEAWVLPALAVGAGYAIRLIAAWRFRQSWASALLHPFGVAALLLLQWWALARKLLGHQAVWKQRAYDLG